MNAMLDKQSRDKAVEKSKARDTMTLEDVPPTNPGTCNQVIIIVPYE